VEIVALIAPTLVEDLLELLLGIDQRLELDVEFAGARHRYRRPIGVDQEETALLAARSIEKLATVGAHYVLRRAGHEWRGTPRRKLETHQRIAAGATASAATTTSRPRSARLHEEDRAGNTGAKLRVVRLGQNRENPLLNPVEVDHRRAGIR